MFNNVYHHKKVLITGNTGFKGAWLTMWLLELGAEIIGISKDIPTNPSLFETLGLEDNITHYFQDIRDFAAVSQIISKTKPDFLFHLAAQPIVSTSYQDPIDTLSTNVMGTSHILEALRVSNHPCTAVMITSDKCYDNQEWTWGYRETDRLGGKDPYSASKGAAELVIKTYYHSYFKGESSPIKLVSARAGNVIGGGDWAENRIVPDCMRSWSQQQSVDIRNPQATRPWQHVLEPLSGYLRAGQLLHEGNPIHGEAYNFGPAADQSFTVLELLQGLRHYWPDQNNKEAYTVYEDKSFAESGLLKLCCDKALHQCNWKPTLDFDSMARFTSEWYARFYGVRDDITAVTQQQITDYQNMAKAKALSWTI